MINKAKTNINNMIDFIKENREAFEYMDLKLHNASFYCYNNNYKHINDDEINDLFYTFCEIEYDDFKEWCFCNGYEFKPEYVGRTSSFFLCKTLKIYYKTENTDIKDFYYDFLWNNGYYDIIPDLNDNLDIIIDDETLENPANLKYIASEDFIKDIKNFLNPYIKMYSYIKDFKRDQVEIFNDFLKCEDEERDYNIQKQLEYDLNIWLDGVSKIIA